MMRMMVMIKMMVMMMMGMGMIVMFRQLKSLCCTLGCTAVVQAICHKTIDNSETWSQKLIQINYHLLILKEIIFADSTDFSAKIKIVG